jgi:anti-sigma-K factor RskA
MHHATWNMKDRSGADAPAGKYTLVVEVTDTDATGQSTSVDFDTSAGPMSLSPMANTYFSAMKLQLQ